MRTLRSHDVFSGGPDDPFVIGPRRVQTRRGQLLSPRALHWLFWTVIVLANVAFVVALAWPSAPVLRGPLHPL